MEEDESVHTPFDDANKRHTFAQDSVVELENVVTDNDAGKGLEKLLQGAQLVSRIIFVGACDVASVFEGPNLRTHDGDLAFFWNLDGAFARFDVQHANLL